MENRFRRHPSNCTYGSLELSEKARNVKGDWPQTIYANAAAEWKQTLRCLPPPPTGPPGAWVIRCRCKHKHTDHDCSKPPYKCTKCKPSPWVCNCNHGWAGHKQVWELRALKEIPQLDQFGDPSLVKRGLDEDEPTAVSASAQQLMPQSVPLEGGNQQLQAQIAMCLAAGMNHEPPVGLSIPAIVGMINKNSQADGLPPVSTTDVLMELDAMLQAKMAASPNGTLFYAGGVA